MEIGDRVMKSPMWKYERAIGTVMKKTRDNYTIIKWDNIPGEWHYTEDQSRKLEPYNETETSKRQNP